METEKTPEETKKKISQALRKVWKERKRKASGGNAQPGSKSDILGTIDQTTQALRRLTLEEISALSKNKGVGSKVDELISLATHLKQVVQSNTSSKRRSSK